MRCGGSAHRCTDHPLSIRAWKNARRDCSGRTRVEQDGEEWQCSPHAAARRNDALILSITSFHGRGLQPSTQLTEGMRAFASVEAVLGLLIEVLFVDAFTRRVTGN